MCNKSYSILDTIEVFTKQIGVRATFLHFAIKCIYLYRVNFIYELTRNIKYTYDLYLIGTCM